MTAADCPTGSAWRSPTAWACRSYEPWCRPNWTVHWVCTKRPAGEPMWCYGCQLGDAPDWLNNEIDDPIAHKKVVPGNFCRGRYVLLGVDQTPLRAFVRALRRLSARRSSSLIPP